MSFSFEKRESIKRYMLDKIRKDDEQFISKTAENYQISVTSVKRYINECIEDMIIESDSENKTGLRLLVKEKEFIYFTNERLDEDKICYTDIMPLLASVTDQARRIWSYGFMEIMNNAIEHANATQIRCYVRQDYLYTEIAIVDDGIGIFRNIQKDFEEQLGEKIDYRDAILELHKGKYTSRPEQHSGEGIFFTSKTLNEIVIWSDNAVYKGGCGLQNDFFQSHLISYFTKMDKIGTLVIMKLENQTTRELKEVFDMYAPMEEGFVRTRIPIKEVCPYGEPIARSQARRVVYRLEQFKQVEFDFRDIEFMGQGFADEVFRVFQNKYPDIQLLPVNANESIIGMIKHVRRDYFDK